MAKYVNPVVALNPEYQNDSEKAFEWYLSLPNGARKTIDKTVKQIARTIGMPRITCIVFLHQNKNR
jgi:hypothetical protein